MLKNMAEFITSQKAMVAMQSMPLVSQVPVQSVPISSAFVPDLFQGARELVTRLVDPRHEDKGAEAPRVSEDLVASTPVDQLPHSTTVVSEVVHLSPPLVTPLTRSHGRDYP